jgi:hypothetical protein
MLIKLWKIMRTSSRTYAAQIFLLSSANYNWREAGFLKWVGVNQNLGRSIPAPGTKANFLAENIQFLLNGTTVDILCLLGIRGGIVGEPGIQCGRKKSEEKPV